MPREEDSSELGREMSAGPAWLRGALSEDQVAEAAPQGAAAAVGINRVELTSADLLALSRVLDDEVVAMDGATAKDDDILDPAVISKWSQLVASAPRQGMVQIRNWHAKVTSSYILLAPLPPPASFIHISIVHILFW